VKATYKKSMEPEYFATVGWTVNDVQDASEECGRKRMTKKEAEVFLAENTKWIKEAMVQAGWDAIESLF